MTTITNIDDAVCKHCNKVIATVPKHYCPKSPNQTHEPTEAAKATVETIDITPRSMQTPEGIRRVNAALGQYEEAVRSFAAAASLFIDEHRLVLIEMVSRESRTNGDIPDDWKRLIYLREAYQGKHDSFLRAVAGAPPQEGQ